MADLIGVNDTLPVRIGGVSSTSGLPDFYADVLSTGQLKVALSDASGTALNSTANALNAFITNTTLAVTQSTSPWVENVAQFGGSAVVTGTGVSGAGIPRVTVSNDSNILATQSGTWTVQQGATPTAVANAWPFKLTDGTNTTAVKAASTAPLATDPAAVVVVSPNGNQATAANQGTQITQLSSIFTAQSDGTQKSKIVDASGNIVTTTAINSKQRLDVDLAAEGVDGSAAPFDTLQTGGKDKNGNLQADLQLTTGEKFVRDVLDVGGQNRAQSVTTTAAEALGGATILANRKVLTIRPTNGIIYWGTTSGVTTATGTPIFTNEPLVISVTDNVHIFLIAAQTTDVRIAELA